MKVTNFVGYIKSNDEVAYYAPTLDTSAMSVEQLVEARSLKLSAAEWEQVLVGIQNAEYPEWFTRSEVVKPESVPIRTKTPAKAEILSPRLIGESGGIFPLIPTLSFDSDSGLSFGSNEDENEGENSQIVKTPKL